MKQKMKTIFKVFALILLITFSSCNEDLYESQTQQSESKFQIKELSKSEIELNLKLSQELNQIQNFKSKIVASKMVYDPVYDFFVNTDEALYISDGVSESYTLPVYRATSNSTLENLVIHIQNEQTLVYLVDYGYSYSEIRSMDKQELEQIDIKHYLIDFDSDILNNRVAMAQYVCIETIALNPKYGKCTETHSNGETCNQEQFIVQSSFCQWVYDDSGNGGDGSTGGTGEPIDYSGGAGNTGTTGNTTSTPINTIPMGCSTCPEFSLELEEFLSNLSPEQLEYWNNLSAYPRIQQTIVDYLEANSSSTQSIEFAINAIEDLNNDECGILPTIFEPSNISAPYNPNLLGDYPAPSLEHDHDAIQQQFNNLRNTSGNLAAVNYLISTYNMNTFGNSTIQFNYSILFANGLPDEKLAIAVPGYDINGNMVTCQVKIDINLFTFTDFGFITRVIKHELYHVLQAENYGQFNVSNAAREFDAYYYQIFGFKDLKKIQDLDLVCQLSKYLIANMNQLSDSEKAEKPSMINLVNQTFPRICPE